MMRGAAWPDLRVFSRSSSHNLQAFYMRLNDDGKTVAAMDLLVPKVWERGLFPYSYGV